MRTSAKTSPLSAAALSSSSLSHSDTALAMLSLSGEHPRNVHMLLQQARVGPRRQEEPTVLGPVQVEIHRVTEPKWHLIGVAVDCGHEFVPGVDAVDRLAQVKGQVLTAAGALAPDVGNPCRRGHDRDTDGCPEPMHAREDRVFANEGDFAAGVFGRQSELVASRSGTPR